MRSTTRRFRLKKEDIAYLKFILEGYQGLAIMRTLDATQGVVEVFIPPGAEGDMELILTGLARELGLREVAAPAERAAETRISGKE